MSAEPPGPCPRCGGKLVAVGDEGRFLECVCGFRYDAFLSREVAEIGEDVAAKSLSPEIEAKAVEWLRSPELLGYLVDAICAEGADKPLLGEEDTAAILLLTLLAKGSVEIRGQTAAGKNTLADHVLSIFPRDWWVKVGGLTDKSLRYLPEDLKILYVAERRGVESGKKDEESTAAYDVKLAISEGEVSVATTERDPETNRFVTVFRRVSIESFIFTTTEVNAPAELENRLTVLYVRDDEAQNQRIRDAQLEAATRFTWEKRNAEVERQVASTVLELVRTEGPEEAIVPYAKVLAPILSPDSSVVRRNTPKVLELVKACAKLHYHQRILTPDGRGVVAAPEDLGLVLYAGQRALAALLSTVPEKAALVWEIAKLIEAGKGDITVENILINAGSKRAQLGTRSTVRKAVRFLVDKGVLTERTEKEGHAKLYDLQAWEAPLVIEVDALLRAAVREYATYVSGSAARLPTEPENTRLNALLVKDTRGAPNLVNSSPDGKRAAAPGGTEGGNPVDFGHQDDSTRSKVGRPLDILDTKPDGAGNPVNHVNPVGGFSHEGICELCGQPGPLTKDSEKYFVCPSCLKEVGSP
jgi:hypothetical protein